MRRLKVRNSIASSNKKKSNIHSLPEEIIIYVLTLLPADVLYHSIRLVCRKWFTIIGSPMFITEHLLHYRSAFLSQSCFYGERTCLAEFGESNAYVAEICLPSRSDVCASCDGLAVVRFEEKLYVVNFRTKQTITLPWVDNPVHRPRHLSISLIRGPGTGDYRVVLSFLVGEARNLQCMFITVGNDDAWKPISCGGLADWYRTRTGAAIQTIGVGGIIYWIVDRDMAIFALDNDMETFYELPNPRLNYGACICSFVAGRKSLSLVVSFVEESILDVWFVSRSGSCFEWMKERKIDLCALSPELKSSFPSPLYAVAWVDDDQVVVLKDFFGCFLHHNVKTGKTFKFGRESIGCLGYFADFTYSLVSMPGS